MTGGDWLAIWIMGAVVSFVVWLIWFLAGLIEDDWDARDTWDGAKRIWMITVWPVLGPLYLIRGVRGARRAIKRADEKRERRAA